MLTGRPSKLPDILANEELHEELMEMAKVGASLCQLYVKMGISKQTAKRWKDKDGEYYSEGFCDLIDELQTFSQAYWESMGQDCLTWEKFQSSVYNKQMAGRFKDDWGHHITTENKSQVEDLRKPKDATAKLLESLPEDVLERVLHEVQSQEEEG